VGEKKEFRSKNRLGQKKAAGGKQTRRETRKWGNRNRNLACTSTGQGNPIKRSKNSF